MAKNQAPLTDAASSLPAPVQTFRHELIQMRAQIEAVLPATVGFDRFARVTLTAVQVAPDILNCERRSLMRACIEAASDGLLPDGNEGAIVPFKNKDGQKEAEWIPMVWGLVKLVRQSGELAELVAHIVFQSDTYRHWFDDDGEHLNFEPEDGADKGEPRLVFAYAKTKDGARYYEVIEWNEILTKFIPLSKAKAEGTPWKVWPIEMAKVRALKRLSKRLPMSDESQVIIQRMNVRDMGPLVDDRARQEASTAATLAALNAAPHNTGLGSPSLSGPTDSGKEPSQDGQNVAQGAAADSASPTSTGAPRTALRSILDTFQRTRDVDLLDAHADLIRTLPHTQQEEATRAYHDKRGQLLQERGG